MGGWLSCDYTANLSQSCQFCPLVPQPTILDAGGFLNFTVIAGRPHEAISLNLPQICCLHEAATIKLPHVLVNNELTLQTIRQYGYY